jgi:hypothetical protein
MLQTNIPQVVKVRRLATLSSGTILARFAPSRQDARRIALPVRASLPVKTIPSAAIVNQPKPAKPRARIPALQRVRILQKSALGKSQRAIAREEKINRESVGRIVHSEEAHEYLAEIRGRFLGLCDAAIEAIRARLEQGDAALGERVLVANGIMPPRGQAVNYTTQPQDTLATEDESVQKTLSAFGRIAMERARVFDCPMPELDEAAERAGMEIE